MHSYTGGRDCFLQICIYKNFSVLLEFCTNNSFWIHSLTDNDRLSFTPNPKNIVFLTKNVQRIENVFTLHHEQYDHLAPNPRWFLPESLD